MFVLEQVSPAEHAPPMQAAPGALPAATHMPAVDAGPWVATQSSVPLHADSETLHAVVAPTRQMLCVVPGGVEQTRPPVHVFVIEHGPPTAVPSMAHVPLASPRTGVRHVEPG